MIFTHSSAVNAVDRLRETALERCLPEVRLQAKLRQYLKPRKESLLQRKQTKSIKESWQKDKGIWENYKKKKRGLVSQEQLNKLSSPNKWTVGIGCPEVGTIRGRATTGVNWF